MKKVSKSSKKGFTLVELLVVIGIIGLLAAIILPKFTGYTEKAIMKDAVSQARTVYTQASAYYAEKGAYPASSTDLETEAKKALTDVTFNANPATDGSFITVYPNNSTTGDFTFVLRKGGKNYTVEYKNGAPQEKGVS
ncbi:type IV pilus assembly protein PilA [Clostridium collagenovorans DSM 3089]|uniref:Type IV pilus assembly protein PilA n=1 Tax=Clostridium collagenovorans DSM 3089 TaxID=1121306 RepID=A0A1M5TL81_9CLOT|nr:type II secretion system protein [Clostridium collagenovorans]SHH51429.1 type IV pilus assembly protein PilA [Clostridium collagenovorans DSM 3089]